MLSSVAPSLHVDRPYPGLRPFESNEAFLFHGREQHTQALLDRLATEHFLAVVGTSGSGKSSLVRAGLLPALYRGYLVGASTQWRIAVMRPGGAPLSELARALSEPQALGGHASQFMASGTRTSLDLTKAVLRAGLNSNANFLLVVDQFEELFRFERERRSEDGGAEAALFVQSLLEAADSYDGRIYVVLTIRSDFLGQCAQFAGLPEALNRAQYLIPHLTRDERQQAIELPPLLAGVRMKPALVQRLLNDLGDDPAMLPVLQHALMRTFSARRPDEHELDFPHYKDAGEIASALHDHAESIVKSLPEGPRGHVERLFRCLTTVEGGKSVRRPARLDRIHAVLGVANAEQRRQVDDVVRAFASSDNSLLVSSTGPELTPESVIDVSHESLIKNWRSLRGWLQAEIRSVEWYRSLAGDCVRFRAAEAGPWRDPELKRALALKDDDRWNEAWAEQYAPKEKGNPAFADVMQFLDLSVTKQREEEARAEATRQKEIRNARRLTWALLALVALAALAVYLYSARLTDTRERLAEVSELGRQIDTLSTRQNETEEQLHLNQTALNAAKASGTSATRLEQEKAALENQIRQLTIAQKKAQEQLQNTASAPKSGYSEALIAIKDLQDQLEEARAERDTLKAAIDSNNTAQKDTTDWKSRYEAVYAEALRLSTNTAPSTLVLPENSVLALRGARFDSRVLFAVGQVSPTTRSVPIFAVVASKATRGYEGERAADFARRAQQVFGSGSASGIKCSGTPRSIDGDQLWCFVVPKESTVSGTHTLGQFRFRGAPMVVEAVAWVDARRAEATSATLTLLVYQAPPAAAAK